MCGFVIAVVLFDYQFFPNRGNRNQASQSLALPRFFMRAQLDRPVYSYCRVT